VFAFYNGYAETYNRYSKGMKCKHIFNDSGSELESEVDLFSENEIEFELLRKLHSD
jgi:hypothetical protein